MRIRVDNRVFRITTHPVGCWADVESEDGGPVPFQVRDFDPVYGRGALTCDLTACCTACEKEFGVWDYQFHFDDGAYCWSCLKVEELDDPA